MTGMSKRLPPDRVSTVHLGQYTRETANEIAGELEAAGIAWWYKEPGWIAVVWEFGVRLFVDKRRLPEAKEIAARIVERRNRPSGPEGEGPA
jgi:hypothetical protein